ncbi:MAG: hypothetical protein GXY82_09115 [Methanospirillum sp.]|nr:hypothetical protein [Methanospirillum sp.]
MPRRNMTVGVTVNLTNYESLRLEVSDEVSNEEEVRSLVQFLDQTLSLFGRDHPETAGLVDTYRRRVLGEAATQGVPDSVESAAEPPTPVDPGRRETHPPQQEIRTVRPKPVAAPPPVPANAPPVADPPGPAQATRSASEPRRGLVGPAPSEPRLETLDAPPGDELPVVPDRDAVASPVAEPGRGQAKPVSPPAGSAGKGSARTPSKAPAPSPSGAVCEGCGAPVSAAEEKTSRLFVSKVLCKKCIQTL